MKTSNYSDVPYQPTPAQQRILSRFKDGRQLPANPDFWQRNDMLPLQALVRRGFIRLLIGPYDNHYLRTYKKVKQS